MVDCHVSSVEATAVGLGLDLDLGQVLGALDDGARDVRDSLDGDADHGADDDEESDGLALVS